MAFKAINFYCFIAMTPLAEAVIATDYSVITQTGMALDTVFQAVFFVTYAFVYRFIALVDEQMHVILAHPLRVFHTLTTPAYIELGCK